MIEELQREADAQRLIQFRESFSENAKIVAIAQAKRDAAEMSGLQKLRATSRARNLSHQEMEPGTFFEKLSNFTKKNKARMHENLAKTAELRKTAETEMNKAQAKRVSERNGRTGGQKQFGNSTWKK